MATLKNRRDFFKLYTPPVPENNTQKYRKLIIVIVLSLSFVATEIVAGVVAHSISIISDAIHLICDVLGYFSSFLFLYLSRKAPNKIMTFGYHRMELLGALSNIFIVWTLILFVIFESTHRILNKEFVEKPLVMMIAATADLLVNIAIYKILHQGPTHSHGLMASPCQHNHHHHHHHDHHEHPDLDSHQGGHQHEQHGYARHHHGEGHHHHEGQHRKEDCHNESSNGHEEHVDEEDHCDHKHQDGHYHKVRLNDLRMSSKSLRKYQQVKNQQLKTIDEKQIKREDETVRRYKQHPQSATLKDILASQQQINVTIISQDLIDCNNKGPAESIPPKLNSHQTQEKNFLNNETNTNSIGMQAAVLHALSDMIMSIGLIISSLLIFFFGNPNAYDQDVTEWNPWHLCDPIATYIFSVTALISTLPVINNSYHLLMNSSPLHLPIEDLDSQFEAIPGVISISHLHVWQLKPGKTLMTAHVIVQKGAKRQVLVSLTDLARQKNVYHTAFQVLDEEDVESGVSECEDDSA